MYIIPDNVIYDPTALCQFIQKNKITRVLFTPSLLQTIIDTQQKEFIKETLQSLRSVGQTYSYLDETTHINYFSV